MTQLARGCVVLRAARHAPRLCEPWPPTTVGSPSPPKPTELSAPGARARGLCGQGHEAEFTDYRDKTFDTVLGPLTVRRAWYRCAECKHGFAPRDTELGVEGTSLSPGLAAMNDIAAATGPFAKAAGLLEDLAGVLLTSSDRHGSSGVETVVPMGSGGVDIVGVRNASKPAKKRTTRGRSRSRSTR